MNMTIRYPLKKRLMIAMLVLAVLEILGFVNANRASGKFIFIALLLFNLGVIATTVTRSRLKPKQLRLEGNMFVIDNLILHAKDIGRIFIESNRVIGVKPKNKRIVPLALCFVIESSSGDGLPALLAWANNNDIDVEHGVFRKWM